VIFSDTEGVARQLGVQFLPAGGDSGAAQRVPRAGGVIVAYGGMQYCARAQGNFVTHRDGSKQFFARDGALCFEWQGCERGRDQRRPGVTFVDRVTIEGVECINGKAIGERRSGRRHGATILPQGILTTGEGFDGKFVNAVRKGCFSVGSRGFLCSHFKRKHSAESRAMPCLGFISCHRPINNRLNIPDNIGRQRLRLVRFENFQNSFLRALAESFLPIY